MTASAPPSHTSLARRRWGDERLAEHREGDDASVGAGGDPGGMPVRNREFGRQQREPVAERRAGDELSTSSQRIWYSRTVSRLPAHGLGTWSINAGSRAAGG